MFKCSVTHYKLVICVHETGEICPATFGRKCSEDESTTEHVEQILEYPPWMRLDKSVVEKLALSTIIEDHNNGNWEEAFGPGGEDSGISSFDNSRNKTPFDINSLYQKAFQERRAKEEVLKNGFSPEEVIDFASMSLDPMVRAKQEQELKVRHFLPPEAHEPEIFMLEKNHADIGDPVISSTLSRTTKDSLSSATTPNVGSGDPEAERMSLQESLLRLKTQRKQEENKRDALLNKAKELRSRAESHKEKLAHLWIEKYNEEKLKTDPLEEVCDALRKELDAENKKRMEAFDLKMKPIIIRDGPSRKANYKIAAAKLHYEIYELTIRLRHTSLRAEQEEQIRELCEAEVKRLREEISEKKLAITTVTKGIPFNRIEVRPDVQLPQVTDPYLLLQSYHRIPTFSMTATSSSKQMSSTSKNSYKPLPSTSSSGSKYLATSSSGSKKAPELENY